MNRPPLLVIPAGPGLPLAPEVPRFQTLFRLEELFSVEYLDPRGTGPADLRTTGPVTLDTLLDDLVSRVRTLASEAKQPVALLGISLGGAQAIEVSRRVPELVSAVIAVSPDLDIPAGDLHAWESLGRDRRVGPPPCETSGRFQRRLRLLADRRAIEAARGFGSILAATLAGLVRCYGLGGALRTLKNMEIHQRTLLPGLTTFRLEPEPGGGAVPLHFVFGSRDLLTPPEVQDLWQQSLGPGSSVVVVEGAGHLAHFDAPGVVRRLAVQVSLRTTGSGPVYSGW